MDFDSMWKEQQSFNRLLRDGADPIGTTKELVLNMMAQCVQLLECTGWRAHRNVDIRMNRGQIRSQLADIHKVWMSLAQVWGVSPEDVSEDFWRKSMVCRQRHTEEWIHRVNQPMVILDLDNVLCNYVEGFITWLLTESGEAFTPDQVIRMHTCIRHRVYIDAKTLGIDQIAYSKMKHQFRVSGAKAHMPVLPGAKQFVDWCRTLGQVVLLTSRPIDQYPNLYGDTLAWLKTHHIHIDHIWWGSDKAEKVLDREVSQHVRFVVDDDTAFITQYTGLNIPIYWLVYDSTPDACEAIQSVYKTPVYRAGSLDAIRKHWEEKQ